MRPLLTAEQMRQMDRLTIERVGVPGVVLMETAGRGVFRHLWEQYEEDLKGAAVSVICGKGNNGGDGYVIARCLLGKGVRVNTYLIGRREDVNPAGDAGVHLRAYLGCGGTLVEVGDENGAEVERQIGDSGLIVDALLGTGLSQDVRGLAAAAIGWINSAAAPVVSVDIPSGVSSDTGRVCGVAVTADLTVTFAHPKRGHYLFPGAAMSGTLRVVDIGIPQSVSDTFDVDLQLLEPIDLKRFVRPANAHKGTLGHVVVVGGSCGKAGAPGLAAVGALRSGAGLSSIAWPRGLGSENRLPFEVMTQPLIGNGPREDEWSATCWDQLSALVETADALVVGPGMGTGGDAREVLTSLVMSSEAPLVLDADALNLLAETTELAHRTRAPLVLTPHPGEAARLLGESSAAVQADRPAALTALVDRYRATIVLKGAHTLVGGVGVPSCLVPTGNAGLATAGSGDVLSGVVGAMLARRLAADEAARYGAYLHGFAGDLAAERLGQEGMLAGDVLQLLPEALRSVGSGHFLTAI